MNLLVVVEDFVQEGLLSRMEAMVSFLSGKGWNLFLACSVPWVPSNSCCRGFRKVFANLPLKNAHVSMSSTELAAARLEKILEECRIDVMDVHPFGALLPAALAAHQTGTPLVVNLHGPESISLGGSWGEMITKYFVLPMAARVCVASPETHAVATLYVEESTVEIIPMGVPLPRLSERPSASEKGRWVVAAPVDGVHDRGVREFCTMALSSGIEQVDVYGDGAGREAFVQWVEKEGLSPRVRFKGRWVDISRVQQSDACEGVAGSGRILLEAAAMNMPVCLLGKEGVKGLLDVPALKTSSWWNYSGRGMADITTRQLRLQVEQMRRDPSPFLLGSLVRELADETANMEKYYRMLSGLRPRKLEAARRVRQVVRAFSDETVDLGSSPSVANEMVAALHACSGERFSVLWSTLMKSENQSLRYQNHELQVRVDRLSEENARLNEAVTLHQSEIKDLRQKVTLWEGRRRRVEEAIRQLEQHKSFRVAKLLHIMRHPEIIGQKSRLGALASAVAAKLLGKPLAEHYSPLGTVARELVESGALVLAHECAQLSPVSYFERTEYEKLLNERLPGCKGVFIQSSTISWDVPLFQRPQHMCMALRDRGYLVVFIEPRELMGFLEIQENLFITGGQWVWDLLSTRVKDSVVSIYSTAFFWGARSKIISKLAENGNTILYEYIDHIDPKISGDKVKELLNVFHHVLDQKEKHLFLASAQALHQELARDIPADRVVLVQNGVDYRHYKKAMDSFPARDKISETMKGIVEKGRPVVGYFGALAPWLDYELLEAVVARRPDHEFVFIGPDYFGGSKMLPNRLSNCHWLGEVPYTVLPHYALHFHVAIIPFERGEVAKTTSPLKLFEYFAMEKPVVVTPDLMECRVYPEVFVGDGVDGFCTALDKALAQSTNPQFRKRLKRLALKNTWRERARALDSFLERHRKSPSPKARK